MPSALTEEVDIWLEHMRRFWRQRLDALGTELARGRRAQRPPRKTTAAEPPPPKSEENGDGDYA